MTLWGCDFIIELKYGSLLPTDNPSSMVGRKVRNQRPRRAECDESPSDLPIVEVEMDGNPNVQNPDDLMEMDHDELIGMHFELTACMKICTV